MSSPDAPVRPDSADAYDLVVIGSGPAGEKGAAQAAYFGKRVALIEKDARLGGAGINTGTIPSKTLRETALYFSGLSQRGLYGIDYSLRDGLTVPQFMKREEQVTSALRGIVAANMERHNVDVIPGTASFDDAHTIVVRGDAGATRRVRAERVLIATGSKPVWPRDTPQDPRLFDSDTVLHMDRIPKSLAVIGAGVIGCEYATMFRALGIAVTVVSPGPRLLPFLDHELSERLRMQLELLGLDLRFDTRVGETIVNLDKDRVLLRFSTGGDLWVERVLFAVGRKGATDALALDRAGLSANDRGLIAVNDRFQTAVPHIYAAGDVVGIPALASTSMEQARVAVCHAFQFRYKSQVASILPMAIYTIPEVAAAGETEETCREKGIPYVAGVANFSANGRGQIVGDFHGMVKLIFNREDRTLLGVHVIGENASEIVHIGQTILHFGGGIEDVISLIFNYPTMADSYKYAAYDALGRLSRG